MAKSPQTVGVAGQKPATNNNPLGIVELSLDQLSQMPLAQYYALQGNFVNVENAVYYDTAVYKAGTAITQGQKASLFTKGKSQDSSVVNSGTNIPEKGAYLTNMISDGEFEGGTTFILEQICVDVVLTSELPTLVGTRGEIITPNYVASVVYSAANHMKAISEQFELQYVRNEDVKLRGKLKHFPSPFGFSGAFGSPNAGFVQNGYQVSWNLLSRPKVLRSEDKFACVIEPLVATWTPQADFQIGVSLLGKKISTYIP